VGEAPVFGFEILPQPSERPAPENLAGAWHPDGGERPLSVGRRVKMSIPDRCLRSRPHAQLEPIHETCYFDPTDGGRCTLSVGREGKMEIPDKTEGDRVLNEAR
jgi:hypothetical protein